MPTMNLFTLLKADHGKVEGLFSRLESLNVYKHKPRHHLFARLKDELENHAAAEEKFFYPAIKNLARTHSLTLESFEEHHVMHILLAELAQGDIDNDEWEAKLVVLKEQVKHHVKEEEEHLFPRVERALSKVKQNEISMQIKEWKASLHEPTPSNFLTRFSQSIGLAKTR